MNVQHLMLEWLQSREHDHLKIRTLSRYENLIAAHISPSIGSLDISTISRQDIQQLINQKQAFGNLKDGKGLSSATVNLIITVLNLAFEYACDMEYISQNPCQKIKRPSNNAKKIQAFTTDEQRTLEETICEIDDIRYVGILLCLYTGLRIGELLSLTWNDIDVEKGILRVNKTAYRAKGKDGWQLYTDSPKTRASDREIPLPEYISELLRDSAKNARSEFVVENKKGERMSIRSYQYMFERLTARAGIRQLNFHALRHTFATRAIECGIDIKTVSDILGHENSAITLNRYAHCMMEHKIKMMQKLPRVLQ